MRKKILWITETAVMLALLVVLQAVTKPLGQQLLTGSCVNLVLAITVLVSGIYSGVTVALISPVMAWYLDIAPMPFAVPVIMLGNLIFVAALWALERRGSILSRILAWLTGSAAKFALMFCLNTWLICGVLATSLALKPPQITALTAMFSWTQLFTALIGGGLALLIMPTLRKALRR